MKSTRPLATVSFAPSVPHFGPLPLSKDRLQWFATGLAKNTGHLSVILYLALELLQQGKSPVVCTSLKAEHGMILCQIDLFDES